MACGMTGERRFLADVLAYLQTDPDEPALEADDESPDQALELTPPDRIDLTEATRLGAAAGAYLRAAAALSEASVLFRVAGRAIELDACEAEAIVDDVVTQAPAVLEQAADGYAQAVDLLSRSRIAQSPDVALHIEELKMGVRALTIEAVRLSPTDDDASDLVDDPDWADAHDATNHDMVEFFADRADTFGAKAEFMAECGKSVRAIADGFATSPP